MGMPLPNNFYPELASKYQMAYVPFYLDGVAGKPALNLPDRVHPNAAGYKVIAANIWPFILKLISL